MAIKALDLHSVKDITFPADTTDPTYWNIGAIDSRTFGSLSDRSLVVGVDPNNPEADADVKLAKNQLNFEIVQFGLKAFRNFSDANGDVSFKTERKVLGSTAYDVCAAEVVRRIPGKVLEWLATEIMAMNSLGLEEGKV